MSRWLRNTLIGFLVLVVILACAIPYAIENVLPYSAIRPFKLKNAELLLRYGRIPNPSDLGMLFDTLAVTVDDSIVLRGWFAYARTEKARGTVLLLHGISDCRATTLPLANVLTQRGFNVVMYDSRANGESGGLDCTFGYYEKHDVSRVIDALVRRYPACGRIAIHGNSLGAAVSVQAMAIDKRIACGVVESPFATLREVIRDYFQLWFLLPSHAIPDHALDKSEVIAHFDAEEVAPEESAKSITQPMLIVHGTDDKNISPLYGKRVFQNLRSKTKIWYPMQGGTHFNLQEVGGHVYLDSIASFIEQNIGA